MQNHATENAAEWDFMSNKKYLYLYLHLYLYLNSERTSHNDIASVFFFLPLFGLSVSSGEW